MSQNSRHGFGQPHRWAYKNASNGYYISYVVLSATYFDVSFVWNSYDVQANFPDTRLYNVFLAMFAGVYNTTRTYVKMCFSGPSEDMIR